MNYVSDCCLADYRLKKFYDKDGNEARDVALDPGQKSSHCLRCGKDCEVIRKPQN